MASHPDYPRTRLYTEHALHAGASFPATKEQTHYLRQVLRLKTDDSIAVFNGRDGEWLGALNYHEKSSAGILLKKQLRPQKASPDIRLLFAPLKSGKTETVVEKATELGVSAVLPVYSTHTIVTRLNQERLMKIAVEAAEQCERLDVPDVQEGETFEKILGAWDETRTLFYCDESGRGEKPDIAMRNAKAPCAVLTGPEGGFSPRELDILHSLPYAKGLSLGPRILKADTAAIAALACVASHLGDWDDKPMFRTL